MWRKDKYYVLHGMTLNWWFTLQQVMLHILLAQECILCRYLPVNSKGVILDADASNIKALLYAFNPILGFLKVA